MFDAKVAQLRVHGQNIERYRKLLQTDLTNSERDFIESRMKEEVAAVEFLGAGTSFHHPGSERSDA